MKYNPDKHHRQSIRLRNYDYRSAGIYFLTICTFQRAPLFGEILDGVVKLSGPGKVAETCWLAISKHFPHVSLDEFVIMPDHMHGLLIFDHSLTSNVGAQHAAPLRLGRIAPGSLSAVIRSFKGAVTQQVNDSQKGPIKVWQRNFYERVIRSERELEEVRLYIHHNPLTWEPGEDLP